MASNQPPDPNVGRLPVDLRPRRLILLPYNDLSINQGADQFLPIDPKGFSLSLAMVYGLGPNEPRVLRTDDAGNLLTAAGAALWVNPSMDGQAINIGRPLSSVAAVGDSANPLIVLAVQNYLWDGVNPRQNRMSSASQLVAASGLGASLSNNSGEWAAHDNPAVGLQAIANKAAGAAGVRHVARSVSFGMSSSAALGGVATVSFFLTDGGATVHAWTFDLPAAIIAPMTFSIADINYVGGAAAAMTVQSDAAHAGLRVFANLTGYDAS